MPVPLPPVSGTLWASLNFGGPYLKGYPQAASAKEKGLIQSDLEYGEAKAQNALYPLFREYYSQDEVDSWTGSNIPPQVQDWADELAAAFAVHLAAIGGRLDKNTSYRDWAKTIISEIRAHLNAGGLIVTVNGDTIEGLGGIEKSAAGLRGPHVSTMRITEVFDDEPLRDLVQEDGVPQRIYTGEDDI